VSEVGVAYDAVDRAGPLDPLQPAEIPTIRPFLNVREAANLLGVSECWIRRHVAELPVVRLGRLLRFDPTLLLRRFQCRHSPGNRLEPEGTGNMSFRLRRYQRGYVYKTGKRIKAWYGMYREDVKLPDGSILRHPHNVKLGTVSELPTKAAAQEALARRISAFGATLTELNVVELIERWKTAVAPTLKATTATSYLNVLRARVVPVFGNWNVSEIGRYDVEMFLADGARKYCRNTLRGMRASLSRILSWAVACEWIEKNPCAGVKLPRAGKKVIRTILTAEEINALAATLHEPYSTLVLFLAGTGLRVGEAIAIKWSDFEGDVLHVCRRIYEGKLDTTKTQGGERSLPIPRALLSRMKALGCGEWVFRSREGTPINPGNALKRYVRPAAKKLGIALGGWHDFRHTLNTTLRKRGWSARVRADILGHASLHMTEEVYDHADKEDFRVALAEIEGQLLRDVTKTHYNAAAGECQALEMQEVGEPPRT
jgi:integrase